MNLLVMKQITLCGLHVTATDALAVSYLLGLNLMQEYYGSMAARAHAFMAMFICAGFTLLCILHNMYIPNNFDVTSDAYRLLLSNMPRMILASAISFFVIQMIDIKFFQMLRSRTNGRWLTFRMAISLIMSQIIDTVLFSYLALYGIMHSLNHVIVISLSFKILVVFLSMPFVALCKKIVPLRNPDPFQMQFDPRRLQW